MSRTANEYGVQIREPVIQRVGVIEEHKQVQGTAFVVQPPAMLVQPPPIMVQAPAVIQQSAISTFPKPTSATVLVPRGSRVQLAEGAVTKVVTGQASIGSVGAAHFSGQTVSSNQLASGFQATQHQSFQQVQHHQHHQHQATQLQPSPQPIQPAQVAKATTGVAPKSESTDYKQEYSVLKTMYTNLEQRFNQLRGDYEKLASAPRPSDRPAASEETLRAQIKAELEQRYRSELGAIEQLRVENQQLISINKEFEVEIKRVMDDVNLKHNSDIDLEKIQQILQEKDEEIGALKNHIGELNAAIDQYGSENAELKDGLQGKNSGERERIDILETEIERLNSEIIKKNGEIIAFKKSASENDRAQELETDLKNTKYELDSVTEALQQKSSEFMTFKAQYAELERRATAVTQVQTETQAFKERFETLSEQFNKNEFELNRLKQTASIKESQLSDVIAERDRLKSRIEIVEEQLDRQREDSRLHANQLEHKFTEFERKAKLAEEQLKDSLKKATDSNKTLTFGEADKAGRLKQLEEEVAQYSRLLEQERRELGSLRRVSD